MTRDRHVADWHDVVRRVQDEASDRASSRRSSSSRRCVLVIGTVVVVVALLVGWVIGSHTGGDGRTAASSTGQGTRSVVGATLIVLAIVWWSVLLVRRLRAGTAWPRIEPLTGLPREERRRIERELSGSEAPSAERLPVLRQLAALRVARETAVLQHSIGWIGLSLGELLVALSPWRPWFFGPLLAAFMVGAVLTRRRRVRWRAFLAAHPDDGGASDASAA